MRCKITKQDKLQQFISLRTKKTVMLYSAKISSRNFHEHAQGIVTFLFVNTLLLTQPHNFNLGAGTVSVSGISTDTGYDNFKKIKVRIHLYNFF
jgi:cell division ATPase FtsA